jgi:hypothetical protein
MMARAAEGKGAGLARDILLPLVGFAWRREREGLRREEKGIYGMHTFPIFGLNSNNSKITHKYGWCTSVQNHPSIKCTSFGNFWDKETSVLSSS